MARVLTCFFRQISWSSGIHVEGFFSVYQGRVFPRGRYPLGWVFLHVGNTYLGRFSPEAIPTEVRVPETNSFFLYVHWIFLISAPRRDGVKNSYLWGFLLEKFQKWYLPWREWEQSWLSQSHMDTLVKGWCPGCEMSDIWWFHMGIGWCVDLDRIVEERSWRPQGSICWSLQGIIWRWILE